MNQSLQFLRIEFERQKYLGYSDLALSFTLSLFLHIAVVLFFILGSDRLKPKIEISLTQTQIVTIIKQDSSKAKLPPVSDLPVVRTPVPVPAHIAPALESLRKADQGSTPIDEERIKSSMVKPAGVESDREKPEQTHSHQDHDKKKPEDQVVVTSPYPGRALRDARNEKVQEDILKFTEENFARVVANWKRPKQYAHKISVVIQVILNNQGRIIRSTIKKSSGDAALDLSALEAVNRTGFMILPDNPDIPVALFRRLNLEFDSNM
ncbi:hypothetical protein OLMES_2330 [Oleiphilus messinensis]|uniref:TonB C-terminal domain-containing protein n=1 Tax=Oleiphilus messinensis TaxID=141451 RepID=A0A1Y0IAH0_9GAMM|nr:TonB family protein [Oleiphilus messinensis]ARU56393.1 hypothetical protein OLMES_2330 [Oleiphilus messinensis]